MAKPEACGSIDMTMPLLSMSSERTINACLNPPPFDGPTVLIASYPKSGTTWTQNIVVQLLAKKNRVQFSHISEFAPFYEVDKHWETVVSSDGSESLCIKQKFRENHCLLGRRVFNTHLRWNMLPHGENYKHIYVCRRGKDVAMSFYQHLSNQIEDNFEGSFHEFVEEWCSGTLPYGKWTTHVEEWYAASQHSENNICMLYYEDMLEDLPTALKKLASYLSIDISEAELAELVPKLTFDGMKAELSKFQPVSVQWKDGFQFLRHGVIGDGSSAFQAAEMNAFERMVSESTLFIAGGCSDLEKLLL